MILCYDCGPSWRKSYFSHYKASRKEKQKSNSEEWSHWCRVFELIDKFRIEFETYLPVRSLRIENCEADDLIAVISSFENSQPIVIVSSDRDFRQLLRNNNITLWNPKSSSIESPLDDEEKIDHIICGDSSDGIPNVLSESDCLVSDKRQTTMTKKRISLIRKAIEGDLNAIDKMSEFPKWRENYDRNRLLIDFDCIPREIRDNVLGKYRQVIDVSKKSNVLGYIMKNRLPIECSFFR
jgi:hypothetical protein